MSPSDLPRFAVSDKFSASCKGRFDASTWIGDGWIVGLYVSAGRFLWCRIEDVNQEAQTCSFCPEDPTELSALIVGESYPFMEWYWGSRAELALDEGRVWHRKTFQAVDMVVYPSEGGCRMAIPATPENKDGQEVIPGGWDHEHCEICNQKIGFGGEPEGYVDDSKSWICEGCYRDYVVPRSLAFVPSSDILSPSE